MNKLYCFQYDINNNKVFRQEYDVEEHKYSYTLIDDDDDFIAVPKENIDKIKTFKNSQDRIIYVYTFTDDVNAILDDINHYFCDEIADAENTIQRMKDLQSKFLKEKDRIAKKYPSGKRVE